MPLRSKRLAHRQLTQRGDDRCLSSDVGGRVGAFDEQGMQTGSSGSVHIILPIIADHQDLCRITAARMDQGLIESLVWLAPPDLRRDDPRGDVLQLRVPVTDRLQTGIEVGCNGQLKAPISQS